MKGNFRKFVEWFPEKLQLSGQIQGFVKGVAYFSSRSLKQGIPRNYTFTIFKE